MTTEMLTSDIELVESTIENHIKNKTLFDFENGIKAYITKINYFKHVDGIDTVEFTPIKNDAYYMERAKLHDDWIIESENWIDIIFK
jgi:hypothetical protein